MHCKCGGSTYVLDSRKTLDATGLEYVRRRLACERCGKRFSTYEIELSVAKSLLQLRKKLLEHEIR